jgi:hypothetical protein
LFSLDAKHAVIGSLVVPDGKLKMKVPSLFLMIVGVARGLFELWLSAGMQQIAQAEQSVSVLGWLFVLSDWALVVGPILVLTGWFPKIGALVALLACIAFTVEVVDLLRAFNVDFLHDKSLSLVLSVIVLVTLTTDVAALRLAQLVWAGEPAVAS